jgi:hypothetical protein
VSTFRLRSAYGEVGDARPYDSAVQLSLTGPFAVDPGSDKAPVERTRELEAGFDLGVSRDRFVLNATVFSKKTSDALVQTVVPPGVGTGLGDLIRVNGSWENRGVELGVRARLIDASLVRADLGLTFTSLNNKVTSIDGSSSLIFTTSRMQVGYPLFGTWATPYTVNDVNGDGVIVPSEVTATGEAKFLGSPVPTRELGVTPSIVIGRALTIAALVDYRGGFRSYNNGERLRCGTNCAALYAPNASIADQARAVDPTEALGGYFEDASFTRLRELSVAWTFATRSKRPASVALIGRNLLTSTGYSGLDPEVSSTGQTRIDQTTFFTLPLPRTLSLRLSEGW